MKPKATLRRFCILVGSSMMAVSQSHAADVIWDITPGTVGAGDSAITGGNGTWDTTLGNWTTDAGVNNIAWSGTTETAVFGGTAGAVNLLSNVSVGGLKFNTTGYSITNSGANTIAFGTAGDIFTDTGVTATISSTLLTGSTTVTKTGAGTLIVSGGTNSTYDGAFTLNEGTLSLAPNTGTTKFFGSIVLNGGIFEYKYFSVNQATTNFTVGGDTTIRINRNGTSSTQAVAYTLGTLSIGSNTLSIDKATGGASSVTFASTTLTGNAVFDIKAAFGGDGITGPLNLGNLSDGGAGRTITKNGPGGDLTWGNITLSGNHIWNVNTGTLTSGAIGTAGFSLTKGGVGTLNLTGALTGGGNVLLNGGTLNFGAFTHTAGTFTLSASSTLGMGTGSTSFVSSVADWDTPNVNLILTGTLGPATTSLRFGTDSTGLSAAQLARITYTLASGVAKPVTLDASGYIRSTAYDGSWSANSAGDWTDITKWTAGHATGADSTATLGNVISLDRVINLNTGTTTGHISALDTTHNYTISGGNILTLDTTVGIPSISVGTAARTLTISSEIQGNDGLNKIGAGILLLSGSNSYTGGTTLTAGTLSIGHDNALGTGTLSLGSANIRSSDATARTMSNLVTVLGSDGTDTFFGAAGTGNLTFTNTGDSSLGSSGNRAFNVTDGITVTFAQTFSGSAGILKKTTGTLKLTGESSYTGVTTIGGAAAGGILEISTIRDVNGGNSSIGNPNSTANGIIGIRNSTLKYVGTGNETNRQISSASTTGTSTIDQSGTGLLKFTASSFVASIGGATTLKLQGSTIGTGEISGAISNYSGRVISVIKDGTGTWTLSGANTYTGDTNVQGGNLLLSGTHTSTTAGTDYFVSNSGSTLGGTGRIAINGNVSVGSTAILAPGASIGTLTLDGVNTTAAVLTMTTGSLFSFELDGSGGVSDQLALWNYLGGDIVLNDNAINLSLLGTQAAGTYTVDVFRFFSNAGTTATTHAFSSGLTIGTLGTGIDSASIDWNGTGDNSQTIALTYTVIPEPHVALLGSLGVLMLLRRRRH